ncbi:MAG: hypothetical protein M5R36_04100 [Deltaproteobacteria bacterium]|nr:hypothetical protein [Deltaproteobacteria bacterium]
MIRRILMIVVLVLAVIGIGRYAMHRARISTYDDRAKAAGRNAKLAESVYFETNDNRRYTNSLTDLLKLDWNLTDDPNVTFIFGDVNTSGYTFTTIHTKGKYPEGFTYKESHTP